MSTNGLTSKTLREHSLRPISSRNEPLSAQIINTLTDYFFSQPNMIGQRLPSERQLADMLGVSRSAVREAIQSLGLLGVVEVRQGDGTYLHKAGSDLLPQVVEWGIYLGQDRVMDLIEARQQVEVSVAGLAARRRSQEELNLLEELLESMESNIDRSIFIDLDISFHRCIASAAGNSALSGVLSSITSLIRVWVARSLEAAGETHSSTEEHRAIYDAILAGDARKAQSAMRTHMRRAEHRLKHSLRHSPHRILFESTE